MITFHDSALSPPNLNVHEFYLARQPILDRKQELFAYELLFRNSDEGGAVFSTDLSATAAVIAHASQLGLDRVIGNVRGFLNVDAAVLHSDIFEFLPKDKIVLEILETVKATPDVIERVAALAQAGFRFALDDIVGDCEDLRRLMPMASIIKVDLLSTPAQELQRLTPLLKKENKLLLAEKVETREQLDQCLNLGFDYFQGYFFARPSVMGGKKLSPSQISILNLMKLVMTDAENSDIEKVIKRDVSLGINLLRLVNTPAVGLRHRVDSLSHALMVLGRQQLRRWLQIMLYAEPCRKMTSMTPLLMLATTRARMMELLTSKMQPNNRNASDTAFTVGIMSLMDTLFGLPMQEILDQVSVVDEVSAALLRRSGYYGDVLTLTECLEDTHNSAPQIYPLLQKLELPDNDLIEIEMEAFEWTDSIVHGAI